ncbi:hypothetical protein AB0B45_08560 [Nonomuraea sp. NPDC049152]|uniref:hypothetical protein n=1 Tax=Nonomuraea sp. NPDC049152 TaxID=3154350 RepID=UPI0034084C0C
MRIVTRYRGLKVTVTAVSGRAPTAGRGAARRAARVTKASERRMVDPDPPIH